MVYKRFPLSLVRHIFTLPLFQTYTHYSGEEHNIAGEHEQRWPDVEPVPDAGLQPRTLVEDALVQGRLQAAHKRIVPLRRRIRPVLKQSSVTQGRYAVPESYTQFQSHIRSSRVILKQSSVTQGRYAVPESYTQFQSHIVLCCSHPVYTVITIPIT